MKGYTFEFDISKVMFDEQYKSDEYETVTLYFFAPKEWLGGLYPEAISAEISVEYPVAHPEAIYATVMMSPTRVTDNNSVEDYDWYDIVLTEPMTDNDNKENYWYTPMYFSPVWTMRRIFGGR